MQHGGKMASVCPMMAASRRGSNMAIHCGCSGGPGNAPNLPVTHIEFFFILPHVESFVAPMGSSCMTGSEIVLTSRGFSNPRELPPKARV